MVACGLQIKLHTYIASRNTNFKSGRKFDNNDIKSIG
jgi:hypothetical protein